MKLPTIPVFKPRLWGRPNSLLDTLDSSWWGTGPKVRAFETVFANYMELASAQCLMTNSCTAALHIALKLFPDCRHVLFPAMTFISSSLPALYEGKKFTFVDVGRDLCIDQVDVLNKMKTPKDVVVAVHFGGHAADLSLLEGNRIIEDCAHALGTLDHSRHVGLDNPGCFSFQATKVLPIGDGGMLTIPEANLRRKAEAMSWCGIADTTWARSGEKYSWEYDLEGIGYKYRANDIMAALALDQWCGLPDLLEEKTTIAERYIAELSDLDWLRLPEVRKGTQPNWQEFIVQTPFRDRLHRHLQDLNISTTVHYFPIHKYGIFSAVPGEGFSSNDHLPVTDEMAERILTIPAYAGITGEDQERVINGIRSFEP